MGWIEPTKSGKFRAGYRDPDGRVRHRTFDKESEAKFFLSNMNVEIVRGSWIDPKAGKVLMRDWVDEWQATTVNLRASTRVRYQYALNKYVLPRFGSATLESIQPLHVRRWVAELASTLSPESTKKTYLVLSRILKAAVDSGLLGQTPCRGIALPPIEPEEMRFLTPDEVAALAETIDPRYTPVILLGAYGGLRWGEMAGLRARRLDPFKAEVRVAEILVELDGRNLTFGHPKTKAGRRTVPLPREVAQELAAHAASFSKDPDDLLLTGVRGGPLRKSPFRSRVWLPAIKAAGVAPLRVHDFRHTAVAFWIAAGAHPKKIAAWAGHSSVSVVLDRYGHLLPDSADDQREALGAIFRAAKKSAKESPGDKVVDLREAHRRRQHGD